MKLTHVAKAGDADIFVIELDNGSRHQFIASNAEKSVHPDGLRGVVAARVARLMVKHG